MDAGLQQPIGGGFVEGLLEHRDSHRIPRVVQQDLRQDQQRLRPGRSRGHLLGQLLKVTPRPGRVACAEQVSAGVRPSPPPGQGLIEWGERRGQLGQFRRGGRSAASGGRPRRLTQDSGGVLVGPLRRQREMPGSFLHVRDDLAQPAVRLPTPVRRRPRVDRRGKQGVGKPDPGTLELHHTLQGSRLEGGPGHRAIRPFEHRGRRRPQARGRQQDTLDIVRQHPQPGAQYPAQVGGHRKRFPRRGLTPSSVQRPDQLEPIKRVSSRGVEKPTHRQPGKPHAGRRPQCRLESGHGQGTHLQAREAPGRQACSGRGRGVPAGLDPNRRQQPDRLAPEPPQRELQHRRARTVEPLEVVDRDNHRPRSGQVADHTEEGQADGSLFRRASHRILHQQRHLQGPPLGRRQLGKHLAEDPVHQIAERRERQRRL